MTRQTERLEGIRYGFERCDVDGAAYFYDPQIQGTGMVSHGFFSRLGGVSEPPYQSLNMGLSRPDKPEHIRENQMRGARALGMEYKKLVLVHYQHGNQVQAVSRKQAGNGIVKKQALPHCDGLITRDMLLPLMTLHADCLPVFFLHVKTGAVGVCHAGWRGVLAHLPLRVAQKMCFLFGGDIRDVLIGVGPGIGPCCFEVSAQLAGRFGRAFEDGNVTQSREAKQYIDLPRAVALQCLKGGILPQHITLSDLCTFCYEDLFFSYRRDRGKTGAMGAMIQKIR